MLRLQTSILLALLLCSLGCQSEADKATIYSAAVTELKATEEKYESVRQEYARVATDAQLGPQGQREQNKKRADELDVQLKELQAQYDRAKAVVEKNRPSGQAK